MSYDEVDIPLLDLRGVACPLNFVRSKLRLEQLPVGARLCLWLDAGEPLAMVPPGLSEAGHHIMSLQETAEGFWRCVVARA